ncbi:hypothetical protein CAPTEDRAFT_190126 [Capitella teleta]|uniref:Uncharacterized protein n=1 Tax=Capitella teleta TaxID=283909 RepID=R7UKZ0_CAPTE|nr:hypothetical protein CAPTEDRAFT_190126 [Capitella teleta]|eukprot:ELU07204.1 hypothetical protein CAPTEDRAFT_190126 [Capitella teleta]
MALRFHWDELAHLIWRRRVSETGRETCEVGEDWIRDMTKEKMNEQVMEVGKEEWKRLLQSTELTRKYAVESCADGSLGASVRMLLRGDCLPIRTNSCVDWRYGEEERDRDHFAPEEGTGMMGSDPQLLSTIEKRQNRPPRSTMEPPAMNVNRERDASWGTPATHLSGGWTRHFITDLHDWCITQPV